uniref:Signal recognition particle protein n=1 Tax=Candidatus Kentrum sp. MB TaxID=2138164 RepID=A0A451B9K2_9GAMM|nr:MAG: signal recognition particle subunit FFH/SRP54 (srp54) [Candidatus Kentron sp. MB]VFK29854.1 MAG: signal recognition particle subunit FFH/SRP54 (srp54) [Candidatus Kentron sp. MB]VFK74968.1 MAG: signal recognition particle subunit FFH/SRP54 (srp54) [Candidatus Kentron sp. MB]
MFDNLTERLGKTLNRLRGQGRLTENNIRDSLRDVRLALLEADVALPVVREVIERIRVKAVGQDVLDSLTPGQELIRVVRDELTGLMGEVNSELKLNVAPPAVIMVAGLQGSGKTTTVAKLARWLKGQKRSVLLATCDVYRPAAIAQLETLAAQVNVPFFPTDPSQDPAKIAKNAFAHARKYSNDVVIIDTAGRMHIDEEMMEEARRIHTAVNPIETLFVVDSMTGQDAATVARAFDQALPLTGIILTKTDGDARGGAALSIRHITGKPIKFLGVGEKTDALQPFHPERIASRILGMGDVLTLIEEAEQHVDQEKAKKMVDKFEKGERFTLEDFRDQLQQMRRMGGIHTLMDKLPGMDKLPKGAANQINDKMFIQMEAILNSMTPKERRVPNIIKGSRKRRIANGSGTKIQDVNRLLKQFAEMQKQMHQMKKLMGKPGLLSQLKRGIKRGGKPRKRKKS